ncbi:glycosyltransferase [Brevibacterium sp. CSND-B09]|uniref:glycosyltransferase n=1 Tax=Brevibacterium sp. CSND-B09 TaxID=3462571 RepID=UPI00406A7188
MLDSEFPAASSKVRLLPYPQSPRASIAPAELADFSPEGFDSVDLHIIESLFSSADADGLVSLGERWRNQRWIPRALIHRSTDPGDTTEIIRALPGAVQATSSPSGGRLLLPRAEAARRFGLLIAEETGCVPIDLPICEVDTSATVETTHRSADRPNPFDEASVEPVAEESAEPVKLVIAGSDFKFAGDLVESFLADDSFDVRFDLFDHHSRAQPKKSEPYLQWADIVLSEFAVQNAIWYSQNLAPHQSLIVHLHGFELLSDWISELNIDNVTTIVVASEFYRHKAHEMRGWPLDKMAVIPNSVNHHDFIRPKHDDARFHLGLVGMVPVLKRPDRVLDLLEGLLEIDDRYTLHIRGHSPWNYPWEWKKAAHQDAYRHFYERIGARPNLLKSIAFEPFSPDMANWLRKIGWVLSPSSRETFHLAAIEGAMSGAVPLAWDREGAREIIGDEWTFSHTADVLDFVSANNEDSKTYRGVVDRAHESAVKYRSDVVGRAWRQLAVSAHRSTGSAPFTDVPRGIAGAVFQQTDALVRIGDFDEAKGVLDRHLSITKNDTSQLKSLEMFVRGLLVLDSRRTELVPRAEAQTSVLSTTPDDRYVRVSAGSDAAGSILIDPQFVTVGIEVVPFAYTGGSENSGRQDAALRPAPVPAQEGPTYARSVVTDVLYELVDFRIAVGGQLRFDRWVEIVAAEIGQKLDAASSCDLFIDAPWHVALPAAIAAGRAGVSYVWMPPQTDTEPLLSEVLAHPYSGNVIAQLVGTLVSSATAVIDSDARDNETATVSTAVSQQTAKTIPNRVLATAPQLSRLSILGDRPNAIIDARTFADIRDLKDTTHLQRPVGALNITRPRISLDHAAPRLALLGDRDFVHRLASLAPRIRATPLTSVEELSPGVDALIVDSSVFEDLQAIPGRGTAVARVRALYDRCRSLGITGIFNASDLVGGDTAAVQMAEKADAVTGTRALLTVGLMARNPNSITRLASETLDSADGDHVLSVLAAVGVATDPSRTVHKESPEPSGVQTIEDPGLLPKVSAGELHSLAKELRSLKVDDSDGVSAILATRFGAQRLPTLFASVAAQSIHPSKLELLVVLNGPEDGSDAVVEEFARSNPRLGVRLLRSPVEGVAEARNLGIEASSMDYVTFIDDDDELEPNYLLNMWLSADPTAIVAAPLRDVTATGESRIDLPNNRRLASTGGRRMPLTNAHGLLGLNACKLIPTHVVKQLHYPTGLHSGEDVAFMSQLLLHGLDLIPADFAPGSTYVRHLRPDSVSRRALTRDFAVDQRLAVITRLEEVRAGADRAVSNCVRALQLDQLGFVSRYVSENPAEGESVIRQVLATGIPAAHIQIRHPGLYGLAQQVSSNSPVLSAATPGP